MPELKNWSITRRDDNPYLAPECRPYVIQGRVYGHSRFADGDRITTSQPVKFNMDTKRFITRSGSRYVLVGAPHPKWVAFLFANGYTVQQFFDLL